MFYLFQFCFVSSMSPSTKLLLKVLLVPYVLLIFALIYLIFKCIRKLRKSPNILNHDSSKHFQCKIAAGFVLALLFTYQNLATTSFQLLNCVPLGDDNVLFIDGNIVCYEYWQYGVLSYAIVCVVPFCLVLLIGPGLLKDSLIALPQFFCACLLPLPFIIYWIYLLIKLKGNRSTNPHQISDEAQSVWNILQSPFRDTESYLFGPLCSAGVLIGQRLILVIIFTFVNHTLVRLICLLVMCFAFLLHHVYMLPYKGTRDNLAGIASITALIIVGEINLVRSGFEAANYIPQETNELVMLVFEKVENVLMLYFPALVMCLILLAITVKVVLIILKKLMTEPQPVSHPPSPPETYL